MIVRLVLWNLAESSTSLDDLRDALDDEPLEQPGRRFAAWVSDESSERFGEISVWDSPEDSELAGPPAAAELLGRDPDVWEQFDLEGWTR
jgi:hypothetical protein